MPKNDRALHSNFLESRSNKVSLACGRPDGSSGPIAMTEAGAVDYDHPILLGGQINQAAGLEVLNHASVAVEQH
jgi:hypothetical protein